MVVFDLALQLDGILGADRKEMVFFSITSLMGTDPLFTLLFLGDYSTGGDALVYELVLLWLILNLLLNAFLNELIMLEDF